MGLSKTLRFILGHPMNRGKPISTLARYLNWQVRSRLQEEVVVNWIDGAKLAARRGMTGATGNIYCGLHEYVDMRFVLDTLEPGDLFVDIGANIGSYTILASKVCGAHTISIEPDPETVKALMRNIDVNGIRSKVKVVQAALGSTTGTISFTVGRDTVNRVAKPGESNTREVAVRTLDEVLNGSSPRVIKIDVEGFEKEVFKGATKTLSNPKLQAIITETLDNEILETLGGAGFRRVYYNPEGRTFDPRPAHGSANSLMLRQFF